MKFFKRSGPQTPGWLIAGLGNPGGQYENTRHNVGFHVIDLLAARHGVKIKRLKFHSLYAECGGMILLKPQTFMNRSGQAVSEAMRFYRLPAENLLVVFDDVSLPPGRLRVRASGSDGGHNGVKDILYHLRSDQFPRIKLGVGGKPHPDMDLADHVLSRFSAGEAALMREAIERAADAAECIVKEGVYKAMNDFNGTRE